jgi:4-hydroxy-tetrahydrodipicolinate reductase
MSKALADAVACDRDFELSGSFGGGDDPLPLIAKAEALIDFTTPKNSVELAALAAQARIVHVIGTTGFSDEDETKIRAAARHAVIVKSGNMSLGVNLLAALVKQAAKALPDFDLRIFEMHHRNKVDAPSGTALMLGKASERRNVEYASLRAGSIVGEHQVILAGPHERVILAHSAEDRTIFAAGALAAAKWGQGRKPGLYAMADVLGLS